MSSLRGSFDVAAGEGATGWTCWFDTKDELPVRSTQNSGEAVAQKYRSGLAVIGTRDRSRGNSIVFGQEADPLYLPVIVLDLIDTESSAATIF